MEKQPKKETTPVIETPVVETPEKTAAELLAEQLSAIDYKALQGEAFKKYNDLEDALLLNDMHTFAVYSAEPIMQERYPGLPQTPIDMVGVRIKNDTAIHTTRIPVKFAKEMNQQLRNTNRYYLLKK